MESSSLNDHYRQLGRAAFSDFRTASIAKLVLRLAGPVEGRLLDVGTGPGVMSETAWLNGWDALGIDISEQQVALAATLLSERGSPPSLVALESLTSLQAKHPERRFDVVTMMDVLEHVEDPVAFLKDAALLLSSGGRLIITVPAHPNLYDERDESIGHRERYTREELKRQLSSAGYCVAEVRYWNLIGWLQRKWFPTSRGADAEAVNKIRYGGSRRSAVLQVALRTWFRFVENRISPPTGLTLVATAFVLSDAQFRMRVSAAQCDQSSAWRTPRPKH